MTTHFVAAALRSDRSKAPSIHHFRRMTVEEAKALAYGQRIPFLARDGRVGEVRVSGAVKLWKRSPERVRVPIKFGLYESGYAEECDGGIVSFLLVALNADEARNAALASVLES